MMKITGKQKKRKGVPKRPGHVKEIKDVDNHKKHGCTKKRKDSKGSKSFVEKEDTPTNGKKSTDALNSGVGKKKTATETGS